MNLESIISITGKPGLYKVLSQIKNGLIVESIIDKKRMPVYASDKVSALTDISIYTVDGDIPLAEVYDKIYKKTEGKSSIDHKSNPEDLRKYLLEVVKDFDQERVYNSDLKKLFQWFNLLAENGLLKPSKEQKKEKKDKKTEKIEKATKEFTKKDAPKKQSGHVKNVKTSSAKGGSQTSTPSKKG